MNKFFLIAAAGLGLVACQKSEQNAANTIDGPVALTVNLETPSTKATVPGTNDGTIIKLNKVEVFLTAKAGDNVNTWFEISGNNKTTHTFYNVEEPTKLEVRINGGSASYENLEGLKDLTAETMQAYGVTTEFKFAGTTENSGTTYDKYTAAVEAKIPVGRIELSGIKHKAHGPEAECEYASLTFGGFYYDLAYITPEGTTDVEFETATEGINKQTVGSDFLAPDAVFPADANVYANNFFPGTMPQIKFVFTGTTKDGQLTDARRYAVIKKMKTAGGQEITNLDAGKIYRIKDIQIADKDYTGDETGNTTIAVEATVTVQAWTFEDVTVEF